MRSFLDFQNDSATCVFLKPETNQRKWKSDGCFKVKNKQDSNHLICECDHLTAFAVMDISKDMVRFYNKTDFSLSSYGTIKKIVAASYILDC